MMRPRPLPVYLVIDTSASLGMVLEDINAAIRSFVLQLRSDPLVADTVRLSIIGFSNDARVLASMADLDDLQLPALSSFGGTNYGPVFRLLRQRITSDIDGLRGEGGRVFRPVVFFITDGAPSDPDWSPALDQLHDPSFRYRPTVVAVGFGSADPGVLRLLAGPGGHAFIVVGTVALPDAVASIFNGLGSSLLATVASSTTAASTVPIPLPPEWIDVSNDLI